MKANEDGKDRKLRETRDLRAELIKYAKETFDGDCLGEDAKAYFWHRINRWSGFLK